MEVNIYSLPKTTTLTDKSSGELKTVTYDAVFLDLNGLSIQIKAVYKADKKMLIYLVKNGGAYVSKEEKK